MGGMKDMLGDTPFPYQGCPPSQAHSQTSVAAATSIEKSIGPLHREILDYLAVRPDGATDEELQAQLDMGANTQRPRRRELQLLGKIIDTGLTRPTKSGRQAVIWRAA